MKTVKLFTMILLAVSLLTLPLLAKSVSYDDAKDIAVNWIYSTAGKKVSVDDSTLDLSSSDFWSVAKAYHIIRLKPKGWVIVSGDDSVEPIIAWSSESLLKSKDTLPPAFIEWMKSAESQIVRAISAAISGNTLLEEKWNRLTTYPEDFILATANEIVLASTAGQKKGPLLTTKWGQRDYYNDQCPGYSDGDQTLTGCIATAMGQIMNYHQWPSAGVGSHSYTTATNDFDLHVNFGSTTYNWVNMSNDDKARISYHSGVAVDMDYGYYTSKAYPDSPVDALRNHFQYDTGSYERRISSSDTYWHGKIKADIDNHLPVYYGGYVPPGGRGGHAFVCDGYDYSSDGCKQYHFNWGWDGVADGWFGIDKLDPTKLDFSYNQIAIFGISPNKSAPAIPIPTNITASDDIWVSNVTIGNYSVSGATHYKIYRATSSISSKSYLNLAYWASYADTAAVPGTKYFYFVKACNSHGCSDYSDYNAGRRRN